MYEMESSAKKHRGTPDYLRKLIQSEMHVMMEPMIKEQIEMQLTI